ncbi:MAG: hypothetical protein JRI77_13630 [Deltaproteobacteria bacterium]|nr:hypothetical protein [Deltaproteobacteria bacterium]
MGDFFMRTTVALKGTPELILEKAVEFGLARSKTDALRLGIFALNREYKLVKDIEMELVARKIIKEKKEMARKGERYLSEEEALGKYR